MPSPDRVAQRLVVVARELEPRCGDVAASISSMLTSLSSHMANLALFPQAHEVGIGRGWSEVPGCAQLAPVPPYHAFLLGWRRRRRPAGPDRMDVW